MFDLAARTRSTIQHAGEVLYRLADGVSRTPFRGEHHPLPTPIAVGERSIDTVDDLAAFTGLARPIIERELRQRRAINFRNEWLATPAALRTDHWYYLSSKTYLFANATHFSDDAFVRDFVQLHVPTGARALEFGGGTGELTLRLASAGVSTTYVELNALQRDFVSFRVARHGLTDLIDVVPHWAPVPKNAFDAVIAIDVIEHLSDARRVMADVLLPSLRRDGVFVENSPFEVNASNPMHHIDFGFDRFMRNQAFALIAQHTDKTRVWRR